MGEPHLGIVGDQLRRKENVEAVATSSDLVLCSHCDGTGNEFYSMYRACPECDGVGVVNAELNGEQ